LAIWIKANATLWQLASRAFLTLGDALQSGMRIHRSARQPDLFEAQADLFEPPPADFIARIRDELTAALARVRAAAALPWKDLTAATLAELRFNSIAGWLPEDEANALRLSFQCEMNRLYAIAESP
jgi:hypothetical protein